MACISLVDTEELSEANATNISSLFLLNIDGDPELYGYPDGFTRNELSDEVISPQQIPE